MCRLDAKCRLVVSGSEVYLRVLLMLVLLYILHSLSAQVFIGDLIDVSVLCIDYTS